MPLPEESLFDSIRLLFLGPLEVLRISELMSIVATSVNGIKSRREILLIPTSKISGFTIVFKPIISFPSLNNHF